MQATLLCQMAQDLKSAMPRQFDFRSQTPLFDTPDFTLNAEEVPNVMQLAFGLLDFCADMGMAHQREGLLPVRLELVLASRLAGIAAPFDGVTTRLEAGHAALDAEHAKLRGMGGKFCIHPMQVAEVKQVFAPSAEELDWAMAILKSGDGVARVSSEMVDEPVRRRARTILERARQSSENGKRKIGGTP